MKKALLLIPLLFCISFQSFSQNWFRDMYDPSVNFFTVQSEFNQWWAEHKAEVLNEHDDEGPWALYKAWEYDMLPQMYATHGIRTGAFDSAEYRANLANMQRPVSRSSNPSNWTYTGPQQAFLNYQTPHCKGRLNCVRFDPVDTAVIYVGAPGGGVWRTTNQGLSWQLMNTDFLAAIGVSDIAINPVNNRTIYTASGDYPSNDSYCLGVYKSNDAGLTWQGTGLAFTTAQGKYISRLLIDPQDTNILMATTTDTLYRSTDGGATWPKIPLKGAGRGLVFKPGDPSVVYAYGKKIYRSLNAGQTWGEITDNAIDSGAVAALALAVTAAKPDNLYVSAADTSGNYMVLSVSDNMGNTFHALNKPNATAGQAWYDLTLNVSPIDTDYIVAGDVYTYYSLNGGSNWHSPLRPSHVDQHDYEFYPHSNTVFSANDGGLFISSDTFKTWAGIDSGVNVGELYNVSSSYQVHNLALTCRQDDGIVLLLNTDLDTDANVDTLKADGTNCLIDPTNDSIMYFSRQNGFFLKTTDGGYNIFAIVTGANGSGVNSQGEWVTPFVINPQNHNSLLIGKDSIYKSTDGGITWRRLNFPSSGTTLYNVIAIAPGDSSAIYVAAEVSGNYRLYRSLNGGSGYLNITGTLPPPIVDIAVSYNNPGNLWVAAGTGVYHSLDSGLSWSLDTIGLPQGYTPRCLAVVNSPIDPLYVGVWWGANVYYTNDSSSGWTPYSTGLPNVRVRKLEISEEDGVIRAATFGRDLWASPLNDPISTGVTDAPNRAGSLKIWPNPNNGDFNIALQSNDEDIAAIRLYDILGNIVYQVNANKNEPVLNYAIVADNISTGIYLVSVSLGGNVFTRRVVITR